VPSLAGVAVYVTGVPEHTGLALAPIVTLTAKGEVIVMLPVDVHKSLEPSDKVTEYDPEAVGVPWIVTTGAVKEEVKPAGSEMLATVVAPTEEYMIGTMAVPEHTVWSAEPDPPSIVHCPVTLPAKSDSNKINIRVCLFIFIVFPE
jgi:hypothetical protein